MPMRVFPIAVFSLMILIGQVHAAYTDYEKTDYLPLGSLPTVNEAMDINTMITSLTQDITDFGPAPFLKSGDDWAAEVEKLKNKNVELRQRAIAESDKKSREALVKELVNNYRLINKANKLAIIKYSEDNAKGKNDFKISQRHVNISQNLRSYASFAYFDAPVPEDLREAGLAALEAATEADETNIQAWDMRIQMLQDMGRNEEADKVKDEMNQRVGETALGMLLPLSPFAALAGIGLADLGSALFSRRKKKDPDL